MEVTGRLAWHPDPEFSTKDVDVSISDTAASVMDTSGKLLAVLPLDRPVFMHRDGYILISDQQVYLLVLCDECREGNL